MAIEKRFTSRIDIKGTDVKLLGQVAQNDHFTNVFVIRLVDGVEPVDISDADYVTVTYLLNGNSICADATSERVSITDYENGEITIILPEGAVVYVGDVIATVRLFHVDGVGAEAVTSTLTSGRFAFRVTSDLSLTKGVNITVSEDQLSILQTISENEAIRVANEAERVANYERLADVLEEADEALDEIDEAVSTVQDLSEAYRAYNPSITEHEGNTSTDYRLDIKYTQASTTYNYTTPNLIGPAGAGDGDMKASEYDSQATNPTKKVASARLADNASALETHGRSYFVPATRTVNGHALSGNVTVVRDDIRGVVKSDTNSSKTLTMSLDDDVLTITYQ